MGGNEAMATLLADLCAALGWQGGTIHDAVAEVRRLRAEVARKDGLLASAHHTIGAQEMTIRLTEARAERAEARHEALRSAVLDELTTLESIPGVTDAETLLEVIDDAVEALGDAVYPSSAKPKADTTACPMAIRCLDSLPVCDACRATVAA